MLSLVAIVAALQLKTWVNRLIRCVSERSRRYFFGIGQAWFRDVITTKRDCFALQILLFKFGLLLCFCLATT